MSCLEKFFAADEGVLHFVEISLNIQNMIGLPVSTARLAQALHVFRIISRQAMFMETVSILQQFSADRWD